MNKVCKISDDKSDRIVLSKRARLMLIFKNFPCPYSEVSIKRADLLREQGRTFLAKS